MCCERVSYVQEAQAEGTITGTEQPPTGRSADRVRHVRRVPSPITFVRAVTLLYGAAALLGVAGLLGTAHLSLHVPPPRSGAARVGWLLPGGNAWSLGIRAGDRVLALDGRPPTAAAIRAWDGRQLTVRTHAGRAVSADAAALGNKSSTWPLLLLSPWFLLLGTLVYLRAGERGVGRVSYALFASAALALALAPGADADNLVATVGEQAAVPFFAAFLALFFLLFPVVRCGARTLVLLLIPALAAGALAIAALFFPTLWPIGNDVWLLVLLAYPCLGIGLVVRSYATVRDPGLRRGLTIVTAGSMASIAPFLALYVAPTLAGRSPLVAAEIGILPLGLLPASIAYAILRHHLLGVSLLQRWLVHGVLWAVLIAAYTAPIFLLRRLTGTFLPEPARSLVLAAALVALIAGSFRWLHDRLWQRLDRRIFKDRYDYSASLQGLSRDLSQAGDLASLGTAAAETLRELMNLDFVALLDGEQGGPSVHSVAGDYQPALLPALTEAAAAVGGEAGIVPAGHGSPEVLVVPLRTQDAVVGHLYLGPKLSGEPFGAADTALLATLGGHLGAMVRNAQLVDELRDKVAALDALNERLLRVQEEERAYLVADIHDEPLQTAIHLHRQLVAGERADLAARANAALGRAVVDQLRALCVTIRPPSLDDLGLSAALDRLARDLGGRMGVPIVVDVEPELAGEALPRAYDLVLYRAAQEALNNCLRHAHPTQIRVALRREGTLLRLSVVDDGAGFVVPQPLDGLVAAGHLGLAGLRTRVQRAGGRLQVTFTPGSGTELRIELPIGEVSR